MPVLGQGVAQDGALDVPHPPAPMAGEPCLAALQAAGVARSLFGAPSRAEIDGYFQQAEAALAKRRTGQRTGV
ncbi:hypothetical protein CHLRE_08g385675v5 [Chlamydomonas reinhardtii]|uniref:Uncharacterized protein n=1 Tax=Chlamydomonas reinhardtii TaxID=3055 RepID=A0A2K3DIE4_CHLRE|nr:uncharacterized protein CHLRE_08g385675v5 [Chlamydomonas reinhardtii]PNW80292.1 hypothetical protein CHLRE_08g385675v5 [Chlamydomonas reinhardtii]